MFKYLKKYWYFALLAPLFMIGEVLMDLLQPRLMSEIVDNGVLGLNNNNVGDLSIVINTGLKMIGLVFLGGCCGVLCGVFANICCQKFANDVRKDCFRKIMSFSFSQTDKFSTGSLITRVTNDITQIQNLVGQCLRGFVRTFMLFGGGIVFMVSLDLSFGVVVACALPVLIFLVIFFIGKANPIFSILQKKLDGLNNVMQENVSGARVVKAYVKEDHEKKRFGKANDDLVNTQLRVLLLFSYMGPLMNIVMNISVIAIIYIGSIEIQNGTGVTPGNVMAAITYVSQILNSIMMLAMIFQSISRGIASGRRINEVLKSDPVIRDGDFDRETDIKGKIEFRNVSFSYAGSGEPILKNINLTINPGETLGILGATGSGKSSLVNLIPRFYDATEGQVLVDDIDVKDYKLSVLRGKVAVALQKSELFSKSIQENIAWGREDASFEEIAQAASIAQAKDFIESKQDGFSTMVAEKGMSLSGGQKQRVAISRAVLKDAEISIFDDSTSALDLKTESALYTALNQMQKDSTKIIITQRVASVQWADRIAVIEDGRIVACDTHKNLLRDCEIYQDIYNSQLKAGGEVYE